MAKSKHKNKKKHTNQKYINKNHNNEELEKERNSQFFLFVFCMSAALLVIAWGTFLNYKKQQFIKQQNQTGPLTVTATQTEHQNPDIKFHNTNDLYKTGPFADLDLTNITDAASENIIPDDLDADIYNAETENEYSSLAIANVDNYVNIRKEPNTDSEIVGKIYNGAVAQIDEAAGDNNDWFKIHSGNVTGYIKAEYFIYGNDALDVAEDYVTKYATVACDRLNVREEPSSDSSRIGYLESNERIAIKDFVSDDEWLKVKYLDSAIGYISAEYVNISEEFTYARTIEEDNAIKKAAEEMLARNQDKTESKKENLTKTKNSSSSPASYSTNSELRNSIVAYASNFLGNSYVSGGNSLETGTDCSGFTSLIYAQYGYGLSRTPQGQYTSNGRTVDLSQIQPGDVVCYSSNGSKCTHVGLYIGNGKIIHSSTPTRGVVTDSITACGQVFAVKNIID